MKKLLHSQSWLLVILLSSYFSITTLAQTNWTGTNGTSWTDPGNWTAGVPDANDNVAIPNVPNKPIISSNATANAIGVQANSSLTINAGVTVTLVGLNSQGIVNTGIVNNSGTLLIGTTTTNAGQDGIYNSGTFTNKPSGRIEINYFWGNGIWNAVGGSSTVINQGTLLIGNLATTGITSILNYNIFHNQAG